MLFLYRLFGLVCLNGSLRCLRRLVCDRARSMDLSILFLFQSQIGGGFLSGDILGLCELLNVLLRWALSWAIGRRLLYELLWTIPGVDFLHKIECYSLSPLCAYSSCRLFLIIPSPLLSGAAFLLTWALPRLVDQLYSFGLNSSSWRTLLDSAKFAWFGSLCVDESPWAGPIAFYNSTCLR